MSGVSTIGDETVTSGINTLSNFIPFGSVSSTIGISSKTLNAGQFNKLFKGTGINSAKYGGAQIRMYNNTIREANSFNRAWNYIAPSTLLFYGN